MRSNKRRSLESIRNLIVNKRIVINVYLEMQKRMIDKIKFCTTCYLIANLLSLIFSDKNNDRNNTCFLIICNLLLEIII